jgi:hypothetical protein
MSGHFQTIQTDSRSSAPVYGDLAEFRKSPEWRFRSSDRLALLVLTIYRTEHSDDTLSQFRCSIDICGFWPTGYNDRLNRIETNFLNELDG